MPRNLVDSLKSFAEILRLPEIVGSAGIAALVFVGISAAVLFFEIAGGSRPYRTRCFANDLIYSVFYRGGFWVALVWVSVTNLFDDRLSFLKLGWLENLPLLPAVLIFWLVGDFALYWLHRLQHSVPLLWAFHRVHHAEESLSTLSQNRRHPIEKFVNGFTLFFPFAFVLGLPTRTWLPWWMLMQVVEALQHAQLPWRYGPLYRVVVSPVFHSIHHSNDRAEHDGNYAAIFSFWDYLFGTASGRNTRPSRYGISGPAIPESIPFQLISPFLPSAWGRSEKNGADVHGGNREAS